MKVEHIGIAVGNLEDSVNTYEKLLNTECYKTELVESQQVNTAFFHSGESKVELLSATSPDSTIKKFIDKRGEGMHHVAFEVDNIEREMQRLRDEGFTLLTDSPQKGADNKLVAFIHPKDNKGVLVELCQDISKS